LCADNWHYDKVQDKCFDLTDPLAFEDAWAYCDGQGADLVQLKDKKSIKADKTFREYLGKVRFWIGLRREDSGSDWKWTDGDDKLSRYMSRKNFKGEDKARNHCVSATLGRKKFQGWRREKCSKKLPGLCVRSPL